MAKEAIEGKPAKSSLRLFLGRFLGWLVEPAAGVAEQGRQKLRLLSAFLLFITINSLIGAIVIRGMYSDIWVVMLGITVICAVGYGLSRTRYYKPALTIALCAPAFSVIGMVIIGADQTGIMLSLSWLVLPFLLASIFLPRRATVIVASSYIVFLAFILLLTGVAYEYTGEVLAFFLMVFFLVIAIAFIRQGDQSRVESALAERTAAEGALADEATRRRILVDESRDGIVVLDEKGKVYEANRRFAEMLGYTPEEVRKLSVWDWEAEYPPEQVAEMIKSVGPEGDHFETRHRRKDGTFYDVEISTNGAVFAGRKLIFCVCRDITARKQAEEALQKSEEKFYKAFRSSPDAMAMSTMKDGRFLEVNDSFLRDYGYSREEVIGHSSKELGIWVKPKDRVRILRIMREKGRVVDAEFEARTKSGEVRTMHFSAEPIDIGGESCLIASTRDITERKRMEEALRESEEKYKTLTEDAPIGIYFSDFVGTFLYGNKKAEEIVGYRREELMGQSFLKLKLLGPKDIGKAIKLLALNKLGKATGPVRFVLNRKDGTKTVVEIRTRITTVGGKKVVLGMVEDISEREKAESALKYQRELIDQIIATIPNAVLVIDSEMRVLLANDTFYKHFGLKKAGVESRPIYEIIDEEELKLALKDTIKNNKKGHYLEFRYLLKGVPRIFIATIVKMRNNRYLVFLNDITEEREKQERLYLTDRLASVGEMASGVAHELNNPLTSIIGLSSLLAKEENMPAETKQDLTAINAEAQRCAAIVKNLLAFARKHAPKREPISVTKVVEDVLKLRAYEHRSRGVSVETDLPDNLPHVEADYFQLQQVFLNIIINAETAMVDTNGQGTLRITGERTDGNIRLSFSDDGPGIAKKNLGLIFNPFFTTKAVGKGTGLGLSISYGIIAAHGGKIQAKNNSDKGATFVVELPVASN